MVDLVKKYVPYGTWLVENSGFAVLLGIIVLIPFSIRHVFDVSLNFKTGAYSDFTSISLYLSDFLVIWLVVRYFKALKSSVWLRFLGAAVVWLGLELLFHRFPPLQTYFSTRVVALLFLAAIIQYLLINREKAALLSWVVAILGGVQSILAIIQFCIQRSVGLYLLGESHLNPDLYGVAKIVAHGTKFIRGYGTFPHSNLLAAFLVASSLLCLYLLTLTYQKHTKVIIALIFSLNLVGILITFSRGGIAAAAGGFILITLALALAKRWRLGIMILILTIAVGGISALVLKPYLLTRSTISDESTKERLFYDKVGLKIIKDRPIIGTGPGLSVLHMEQYSPVKLETWEIQPIHNYFLITFAEWGIGGLILLGLIIAPILGILKKARGSLAQSGPNFFWEATLASIGICFLFLFLFDHYFYTIWQTQLLLWIFVGLTVAQIKKPIA